MPETENSNDRVGVEIEFSGLSVPDCMGLVQNSLGGEAGMSSAHVAQVRGSEIGDVMIELDTRYAKAAKDPGFIDQVIDTVTTRENAARLLSEIIAIPVEVITEPLPRSRLRDVDRLIETLREAGAVGTKGGTLYAFGLHLNIEHTGPIEEALRISAAYTFAERWLRERMSPDNARRVTPFIDPMPVGYVIALAERYADGEMGLQEFTELYGHYNPGRNRGLDMWPLLGDADRELAGRHHRGPLPPTRPAFHFRLPDSRVDDPGWSPQNDLARWDRLAAASRDDGMFETLRAAALEQARGTITRGTYIERLSGILG